MPAACYWVAPGSFMAGAHPCFDGEARTPTVLLALARLGIGALIDLTEPGEVFDYEPLLASVPDLAARTLAYRRIAIPDMSVPSPGRMREVLDRIDDSRSRGRAVYLHCFGGLGRTGTVVGCHLARGGMGGESALERIAELRSDLVNAFPDSPVTEAQRRFVREWRVGA